MFTMPTLKKRINVTVPEAVDAALEKIASRDGVPIATKAAELLQLAIEIEEDEVWDELATLRDTPKSTFIPHEEAWV